MGVRRLEEHRKASECSDAFCRESQAGNGREAVVEQQQGSADPATLCETVRAPRCSPANYSGRQ